MSRINNLLAIALTPLVSLSRWLNRKKITILYLHGIHTPGYGNWLPLRSSISLQTLRQNLHLLAHHYQFISLSQAIDILNGNTTAIDNALVITLDDGYLSQITLAMPEFEAHGIIPTIYVSTYHTALNKPFWFDRLDYALQQLGDSPYSVQLGEQTFCFDTASKNTLSASYRNFRAAVKRHFKDDLAMRQYLDKTCSQIEKQTGRALSDLEETEHPASLASWQQLNDYVQKGLMEVGNHTVHHARLANLGSMETAQEINNARLELEFQFAAPGPSFCYPDNSYTPETKDIVKACGYQCALTTNPGLNGLHCDLTALKRFNFPHQQQPAKALFAISILRCWLDKVKP